MEIIIDLFGWMGSVLKSFAAMRTNDGIVAFLMGNAVLIGGIIFWGRSRAKTTKGKKDDNFWSGLQGMFSFMAPKMKLPPNEQTTDESEVQDGQKT
jgi:hypothetical protein